MTVESKRAKTTIKLPGERTKQEKKLGENNSKLLLSVRFDFDPEEISNKSLLFNLKKTSEKKIFDLILEKILDKNDIYYSEHREGTNTFRKRKDSKQETIDRGVKRATSKPKLSQLKRIKKQLIKKSEDLGEELIDYE